MLPDSVSDVLDLAAELGVATRQRDSLLEQTFGKEKSEK